MDYKKSLRKLSRIGYLLSAEKDIGRLMHLVLKSSREMLSCDSGTIYIRRTFDDGSDFLEFSDVQNDSMKVRLDKISIPARSNTVPGYAASKGDTVVIDDAYALTGREPYGFSHEIDDRTGYRTKSILAIPMKDKAGDVLGVISLYNKKDDPHARLKHPEDFRAHVLTFNEEDVELASSVASQAAIALENAQLYNDITRLFEGFVSAAVTAVEYRDPATAGHSSRVAMMTVELARKVDKADTGPYKDVNFTRADLLELHYACLLHDFGKIGVRENILLKRKKLYGAQYDLLRARFSFIKESARRRAAERKLTLLLEKGPEHYRNAVEGLERASEKEMLELDETLQFLSNMNDPQPLRTDGVAGKLAELAARKYMDFDGAERPLLDPSVHRNLSVNRGSLNDEERAEIQSHVVHSYNFLNKVPWTKDFKMVAEIAYAHHEKSNGTGYPRGLMGHQIPIQSRMMIIADIFDALTASDRPYKNAIGIERALFILELEVKEGAIDQELFRIFKEENVYDVLSKFPG